MPCWKLLHWPGFTGSKREKKRQFYSIFQQKLLTALSWTRSNSLKMKHLGFNWTCLDNPELIMRIYVLFTLSVNFDCIDRCALIYFPSSRNIFPCKSQSEIRRTSQWCWDEYKASKGMSACTLQTSKYWIIKCRVGGGGGGLAASSFQPVDWADQSAHFWPV